MGSILTSGQETASPLFPDAERTLEKHTMTKKVISTIKHYKREKDGTLRFVGIEKREVEELHWGHIKLLDLRDKADAHRLAHEQEDFERLVDAACACGE